MKRNLIFLSAAIIMVSGCGEAAEKSQTVAPQPINTAASTSIPKGDHSTLVEACMKFETPKVCNCIASAIETELDVTLFKKVAENARNGAVTPSGWQQGMSAQEREKFALAMKSWNASCELN